MKLTIFEKPSIILTTFPISISILLYFRYEEIKINDTFKHAPLMQGRSSLRRGNNRHYFALLSHSLSVLRQYEPLHSKRRRREKSKEGKKQTSGRVTCQTHALFARASGKLKTSAPSVDFFSKSRGQSDVCVGVGPLRVASCSDSSF